MASQPIHYEDYCENALGQVQGELLEALLQPEEEFYPWNPAEPEAEAYFAELERGFFLSDWQDEAEITRKSQSLFDQLHQCWASVSVADERLRLSLSERFAAFIPQAWLEAIANKAQQIFPTNLSLADQLVLCVKPLLPNWAEEDLLVLARPLAYAMRGSLEPDIDAAQQLGSALTSNGASSVEWTELSQMEKARLSLAVAHSAIAQLKISTSDPEQ